MKHLVVLAMAGVGISGAASAQTSPKLTLTETLRLDATDEDFPSINSAFIGPRGLIAVPLMADNQLRLYDSSGKRIAAVGRRGAGPGEFERMLRYGWVGDTVWIYDSSHRRFTLISAAGRVIRTMPLVATLNAGMQPGLTDFSTGVLSFVPNTYSGDGSSLGPGMLMKGKNQQGTVDTDNWVIRTNAKGDYTRISPRPSSDEWAVDVSRAGSSWGWAVPFVFQPQTTYAPDGKRFAMLTVHPSERGSSAYRILVVSAEGDTLLNRSYPYVGEAIPARQIDSAMKQLEARAQQTPPDVVTELLGLVKRKLPATYSPVSTIYLGRDNTLWVVLRRTANGTTSIVHNSKGDPIATLQLPPRSRLLDVSLSEILVSEADDDGLASIVRYRVAGRTCGPPECR